MFLAFQGRSFDIADRTFRDLATTWWLSSSESATDVKELIPEFFYLPEFLFNAESELKFLLPSDMEEWGHMEGWGSQLGFLFVCLFFVVFYME